MSKVVGEQFAKICSKKVKATELCNFSQNVHASTDETTTFCDEKMGKQLLKKDKYAHDLWRQQMTNFAFQNYKQVSKEYQFYYKFGDQLRPSKHKKLMSDDMQFTSQFDKTVFSDGKKQISRNFNLRQKEYDFEKIKQNDERIQKANTREGKPLLSLAQINKLDSELKDQFLQYRDYQQAVQDYNYASKYIDKQDISVMNAFQKFRKKKFIFEPVQNGLKFGQHSDSIQIDYLKICQKDLLVLNSYSNLKYLPSNYKRSNIDYIHMFGLSSGYYNDHQLKDEIYKAEKRFRFSQRIQGQNQLELQLNQINSKITILKNERLAKKNKEFKDHITQTEKVIANDILKDLIFFDCQVAMNNIANYSRMKQSEIQKGKNPLEVYSVINQLISQNLLKLLFSILQNQSFIYLGDYMADTIDENLEKKIVLKLHNNLSQIQGKFNRNGLSKIKLLKYYTQQKIILQKDQMEFQRLSKANNSGINSHLQRKSNNKQISKSPVQKSLISKSPLPKFSLNRSNIIRTSLTESSVTPIKNSKKPNHLRSVAQESTTVKKSRRRVSTPDKSPVMSRSIIRRIV